MIVSNPNQSHYYNNSKSAILGILHNQNPNLYRQQKRYQTSQSYSYYQPLRLQHWSDLLRSEDYNTENQISEQDYYIQEIMNRQLQSQSSLNLSEAENNRYQQQPIKQTPAQQNKKSRVIRSISSINVNTLRRNMQQEDRQSQNIKFIVQTQRERIHTEVPAYLRVPLLRQKNYLPELNNKSLSYVRGTSNTGHTDGQVIIKKDKSPEAIYNDTKKYIQAQKNEQKHRELISIYGSTNYGFYQQIHKKLPGSRQNVIYQQPIYVNTSNQHETNTQKDFNAQNNFNSQNNFISQNNYFNSHNNFNQSRDMSSQRRLSTIQRDNSATFRGNSANERDQNLQREQKMDENSQNSITKSQQLNQNNTGMKVSNIEKLPSLYQTAEPSPRKVQNFNNDDEELVKISSKTHSNYGTPQKLNYFKELRQQRDQMEVEKQKERQKRRVQMFKTTTFPTDTKQDEYITITGGGEDVNMYQNSPEFYNQNTTPLPKITENQFNLSPIVPQNQITSKDTGVQVDFQAYTNLENDDNDSIKATKKMLNSIHENDDKSTDQKQQEYLSDDSSKSSDEENQSQKSKEQNKKNLSDKNTEQIFKRSESYIPSEYKITTQIEQDQQQKDDENQINMDLSSTIKSIGSPNKQQSSPEIKKSNLQSITALHSVIKPRDSGILKVQKHKFIDPLEDMNLQITDEGSYKDLSLEQDKEQISCTAYSKKTSKGYSINFKRISSLDLIFPEIDIKRAIDIAITSEISEQFLDFRGESILRISQLDEYEMEKQFNSAVMEKETNGTGQFLPRNAYVYKTYIVEQFDRFYFLQDQIGTFIIQKEALSEHQFKSLMLNLLDVIIAKRITRLTHENIAFCVQDQKFYCIDRLFNYVPIDDDDQDSTRDPSSYIILQDLIDVITQIKFQTFSRHILRQQLQVSNIKSPFLSFIVKELQNAKQQQQQQYINNQQQNMLNSKGPQITVFTQLENIRKNIFQHRLEAHDIVKRDGDIFSYQTLMKPRRFRQYIDKLYYDNAYVDLNILKNDNESKKNSLLVPEGQNLISCDNGTVSSTSLIKDSSLKSLMGIQGAKKLKDAVKKTQKKSIYEIMFDQAVAKKDSAKIIEYGNHMFPKKQITRSNVDRLYSYVEAKLEKNDLQEINFFMSKYVQICCEENSTSIKYAKMQLQLAQHNIHQDLPLSAAILICIYLENKFQNIQKYEIEKRLAYNLLMSELSEQTKIVDFEIQFLRDSCSLLEASGDIEDYAQTLFQIGKWYLRQDRIKKGIKYLNECIKTTQKEQLRQYCLKILQNVETSMKQFKTIQDHPKLARYVKEGYSFYNEKNVGEVDNRLQKIRADLGDQYHLKEREAIDLFYLCAKEQIKYNETSKQGGQNLNLFQGYANSSDMYSDDELKSIYLEIYGIYGDLYVKDKRQIEALLEYFSKIVLTENNRHEEFEPTLLKMAQLIYELNYGEYLGSFLNCLNSNKVIYKAIETLHLLAKSETIFQEVESNLYSQSTTQYNSTYMLTKALTFIEEAKVIGIENIHIKLEILLKILDVEYQIIDKLGDPQLIEKRIETLKENFEKKLTDEEQFLLFQEYFNIQYIDSAPIFDINLFSKCEKAVEMAINYKFYTHALKDLEICLNLKMEIGVNDVSVEIRSILSILDQNVSQDEIKKCLDLIQIRMDNIESDEELFEFVLKFTELSQDKERVVEMIHQNIDLIIKMYKKGASPQLTELLYKKAQQFAEQNGIDESLHLNGIVIQLLQFNEIKNSNFICKVFIESIKLCYFAKKLESDIVNQCDCFFAHLVNLSKNPSLNKNYFKEIHQQISTEFGDKTNKFKNHFKNYLRNQKITNPQLIELAK